MARKDSLFKRSALFAPESLRRLVEGTGYVANRIASQLSSSNINLTSSFRYASPSNPAVKSTQQIPLDWSKFENHTFFNSAESKVNVAFDRIINDYPFDGTFDEYETFFDLVTGFEKYVYDSFPKFVNFLHFSGATGPTTTNHGTYISTMAICRLW